MADERTTADDPDSVSPQPAGAPEPADAPAGRAPAADAAATDAEPTAAEAKPAAAQAQPSGTGRKQPAKARKQAGRSGGANRPGKATTTAQSGTETGGAETGGTETGNSHVASKPAKAAKPAKADKSGKTSKAGNAGAADTSTGAEDQPDTGKPRPAPAPRSAAASPTTAASGTTAAPGTTAGPSSTDPMGPDSASPIHATAVPGAWAEAAWEALRRPDQPPHRLATLAVAEIGPRAAGWAAWLRRTYPDPPAHGITRLATRQAVTGGYVLAAAEAAGPLTAPVRLAAAAWVRATVVLRIAAAHGHDPADPGRAEDLIELLGLHSGGSDGPVALADVGGAAGQLGFVRFAVSRLGLRRGLAAGAVRSLIAAGDHHDQLTRLAHRTAHRYRSGQLSAR